MIEDKRLKIILSVIFAFMLTTGFLYHSYSNIPEERQVAVIVLDGGDWQVINQMAEKDKLPHTQELIENGVATDFGAPEAFSPQSWTMMGTGMTAENLSFDRSWSYETDEGMRRMDSRAVERRRFWSYMNDYGIETGIYSWLMTWPVEEVNGFMIGGHLTGNIKTMSYPHVSEMRVSQDTLLDSMLGLNTYDAADKVLEEYYGMDVLSFGFVISDRMKHNYWKFLDEEEYPEADQERELIYRNYEEVDDMIGELRNDYTVVLVSDHGFIDDSREYDGDINLFLREIGLAEFERNVEQDYANERRMDPDTPLLQLVHKKRQINDTHYEFVFDHRSEEVTAEEIKSELEKVSLSTGERFFQNIRYNEGEKEFSIVLYFNRDAMGENQVRTRYTHLSYARGEIPINDIPIYLEYEGDEYEVWIGPELSGNHPPGTDGIFIAGGEGIEQKGYTEEIDIGTSDLAPLLLYLKGVPIPEKMDGDVPIEIFKDSYVRINEPEYGDIPTWRNETLDAKTTKEQDERIQRRLAELGYLTE